MMCTVRLFEFHGDDSLDINNLSLTTKIISYDVGLYVCLVLAVTCYIINTISHKIVGYPIPAYPPSLSITRFIQY